MKQQYGPVIDIPAITLRTRLLFFVAFAILLLLGAIYSAWVAIVALVSTVVLAAGARFTARAHWLRAVWYGGLLVGAFVMYLVAPAAAVNGAVSSCGGIPAVFSDSPETSVPANMETHRPALLAQYGAGIQKNDLTYEATYFVQLEPNHVRYEERVDLHLERGHFVHLDLSTLGLQSAQLQSSAQIIVGGDGMTAETFAPNDLAGPLRLSTRPSSVWVETRMLVPQGAVSTCAGVALMPFQKVALAWPVRSDVQIRGLIQLPSSDEPVPFTQGINKKRTEISEVLLPRYSLFRQNPVLLQFAETRNDGNAFDRFEPASAVLNVADFSMRAELLPDTAWIRNRWVYEHRDLFFPPNWALALAFVLIASLIGDVSLSKRRD